MATVEEATDRPSAPAAGDLAGSPWGWLPVVAAVAGGLALAVIVGRDGEAAWRVVRVLTVGVLAAGAVGVLRPGGRPAGRGLLAAALGLVTLAVGAGIGGPHLAKVGWSLATVAGLVALVAGLVLFVWGLGTLLRSVRWWGKVGLVLAAVVAVGVGLLVIAQAVAVTNVPRTDLAATTPADQGAAYDDVTFPTDDGVTLSGWWLPSEDGAAVVLLHGAGSTRSNVLEEALVLHEHGYGVLAYDARGHGRSGGRAMDFGWYGDLDVAAAVSFVAAQDGVDPARIGVVGSSMGGEQAIGAAAADERIRAVVAEGATVRTAGDRSWLSDEYGLRGAAQELLERLMMGLTDLLTDAEPPITLRDAVARAAPRPVLLVTAGDVPDERLAAEHIRGGAPEAVTVWEVPGAAHADGLAAAPDEWRQRVTAFLDEALGGGG